MTEIRSDADHQTYRKKNRKETAIYLGVVLTVDERTFRSLCDSTCFDNRSARAHYFHPLASVSDTSGTGALCDLVSILSQACSTFGGGLSTVVLNARGRFE
jgi:hypothetical protein